MQTLIRDLDFGYSDASQYSHGKQKDFFNRYFYKTPQFAELSDTKKYFIIGEKGTGKTALAVFASNGTVPAVKGRLLAISSTEYKKFIELKNREQLEYSDYSSIWRVILLLLMSQHIRAEMPLWEKAMKLSAYVQLNEAIDSFFSGAFTPEVAIALEVINRGETAAKFNHKLISVSAEKEQSRKSQSQSLNLSLISIERKLKDALSEIRVKAQHILFIDDIDHRPYDIYYKDYMACIDGLLDAAWILNHGYFSEQKKIRAKMKVMVLCRPDLIYSSGMHNAAMKISDNGICLNWLTNNTEARRSPLYAFANHIIGCEQSEQSPDWIQRYWPDCDIDSMFRELLRLSWHRPRDFVTLLRILKENRVQNLSSGPDATFTWNDMKNPALLRKFSDYMLGEVKDFSLFYMSPREFDAFLSFFQYLGGKPEFSYQTFVKNYSKFIRQNKARLLNVHKIMDGEESFLQFLYEMNIVGYKEQAHADAEPFFHWAFRERTPAELRPLVKLEVMYKIHSGIAKALNIGKPMRGLFG